MASTPSSPARERRIRLSGTRNLRDIGGYPAGAGRQTRWGTLFRADALDRLPAASQEVLVAFGIRHAIDLRWSTEAESAPSVFRGSPVVRYTNLPVRDPRPSPFGGLPASYRRIIDDRGAELAGVAAALVGPIGVPAIVTCAAGVDRTGLAIAIVLSAVGVPADVVAADYAMSTASFVGDGRVAGLEDWRSGPIEIDCLPEYMHAALGHLLRRHGGAAAYLVAHGLADGDIDRLRELLTEPIPSGPG
jgi:protein-tyrosine phosphatase